MNETTLSQTDKTPSTKQTKQQKEPTIQSVKKLNCEEPCEYVATLCSTLITSTYDTAPNKTIEGETNIVPDELTNKELSPVSTV